MAQRSNRREAFDLMKEKEKIKYEQEEKGGEMTQYIDNGKRGYTAGRTKKEAE